MHTGFTACAATVHHRFTPNAADPTGRLFPVPVRRRRGAAYGADARPVCLPRAGPPHSAPYEPCRARADDRRVRWFS